MRFSRIAACCLFVLVCCAGPVAAQTPSFQILTGLADFGTNFEATSVSADGAVIIGKYFLDSLDPRCAVFGGCTRAFIWTAATGAQDLGLLDSREAEAHGLSADGSLIVGEASSRTAFRRSFIRTPTTGMQDIGTPIVPNEPDFSTSRAFGISATGSVIVGESVPIQTSPQPNLIPRAFRFTPSGGFEFLTTLPNEIQSRANAVSADGTVIVGDSYDTNTFLSRAFRWKAGVAQDLGNLGGGESFAMATSSDGSVVVGLSRFVGGFHPFRWTAAGMQDLGDLGGNWATASGVSADGSVVVGTATPPPPGGLSIAIRWTASSGLENLNAAAARAGVSLAGWQLVFADAVSADGRVIVGMAQNSTTNVIAGYRLVLPPPVCARVTCASLGKNCGAISDGCGGTLTCGGCTAPQSCGGGGVANVCGPCTATTSCAAQAATCNAIPDGCGWVACGTCAAPQVCGGGGNPTVCAVPAPVPSALTFSPSPVVGGNPATGTVTLSQPAPAGGALVTLSSSPGIASAPPNVTVSPGATSASYPVATSIPAVSTAANLSACFNNHCVTNTLFITAPPSAVQVASLTVTPASVTSGTSASATVTLSAAAPSGGASVTLSSSNPAATVPPSVTVPAGSSTATFTVTTQTVTTSTALTISASFGGVTATASLAVTPPAPPPTITRAELNAGQLRLEGRGALPNHAILVDGKALGNSDATGAFKIQVQPFSSPTCAVSVNGGGSSAQATLSGCTPTTPTPPGTLSGLTLSPTSVVGPASSTATVTLTSAAPAGGIVVTLSSSNSAVASVPALGSVTVAAGATSATFTVTTVAVTASSSATITGTAGTVTKTAVLTVTPPPPPAALSTLTLNPTSVVGPASSTATVTLTSAAPAGGLVITLASSNSAVASVPALGTVTVQAGATSATFTVTTVAVTVSSSASITATAGTVTKTAVLTVTPPAPPAPPPPPPAADTVAIKVAEYVVANKILNVQASSTSTSATLSVSVTSTGAAIGTLTNNGGGKYTGAFSWPVNPTNVTVKSSLGGAASSAVKAK
ncbi:MAG: hypothetical protein DMD91_21045 [Candidatus Rokuibacteriota bacterium]|nr:MAG: hypothetical protein DMD91_21045 [Candidatus Rokubacteria bacterium]